jgi:hypothetical protein
MTPKQRLDPAVEALARKVTEQASELERLRAAVAVLWGAWQEGAGSVDHATAAIVESITTNETAAARPDAHLRCKHGWLVDRGETLCEHGCTAPVATACCTTCGGTGNLGPVLPGVDERIVLCPDCTADGDNDV